jgi:hypothetical protein
MFDSDVFSTLFVLEVLLQVLTVVVSELLARAFAFGFSLSSSKVEGWYFFQWLRIAFLFLKLLLQMGHFIPKMLSFFERHLLRCFVIFDLQLKNFAHLGHLAFPETLL